MQQLTIDLWLELSRRYKDRNVVAAYSLLAEPMSAPTTKDRDDMYDRLIKAIRGKGDDHLLIIHDGFKKMNSLPNPSEKGWEQVVYSTHIFEWGAKSLSEYDLYIKLVLANFKLWREKQNVPYYIGSFSTMQDKEWAYQSAEKLVKYYNQNGMSWSLWTFKRIDNPVDKELWGESTAWGLLGRLEGKLERVDIHRDDKATILKKLSNYANLNLKPNTKLLKALAQPVP